MRKQFLSIEQMRRLRSLGIDVSKASTVLLFSNENGEHVGWEVENNGKDRELYEWWNEESETWESASKEYFDAETGDYDHSEREWCGVFDLQDILEILEKVNYESFSFPVMFFNWDIDNKRWEMYFRNPTGLNNPQISDESPLECAYKMLVWCAENGKLRKE